MKKTQKIVKKIEQNFSDSDNNDEPPNDFRELSVNPTPRELHDENVPYLQPIKVEGSFDSVYQYLDANFRLLKEDFMQDLRVGLQTYI